MLCRVEELQRPEPREKVAIAASLAAPGLWLGRLVAAIRVDAGGAVDGNGRRKGGREEPAAAVAADAEAALVVAAVKVAAVHAVDVAGGAGGGGGEEQGLLHLAVLLDELARDDAKDLLDALAVLGANLVARVPAHLLAPEAGAALGAGAARLAAAGRGQARVVVCYPSIGRHHGRGRRGAAEARGQVLGHVGDAALKGHLAGRGVAGDNVGLCADDVQDDIVGEVLAELRQPHAHVGKGLRVGNVVAEDAGVGAAVV